jgi:precorrin-6B methylase 2
MRRRPLALVGCLTTLLLAGLGCSRANSDDQPAARGTTRATAQTTKDKGVVPGAAAHQDETQLDPSGKDIKGPAVTLKVLLPNPDEDWHVLVDEHPYKGDGKERLIKVPAKKSLVVTAVEIPNNYTWRYRTRTVAPKPGMVTVVDLRKEDPTRKDHIEVRFVPTPEEMVDAMCKMAKVGPKDVVYDLGCGDGIIVITAVKKYHAKRGVGIDIDPDRVKDAKEAAKEAGVADKVEIRQGDVLKIKDLHEANVVMLYMGDDINLRLRPILNKTLKPGSRVVSHRFKMGDWKPDQSKQLSGDETYSVHMWIIRGPKGGTSKEGAKQAGRDEAFLGNRRPELLRPLLPLTGLLAGRDEVLEIGARR